MRTLVVLSSLGLVMACGSRTHEPSPVEPSRPLPEDDPAASAEVAEGTGEGEPPELCQAWFPGAGPAAGLEPPEAAQRCSTDEACTFRAVRACCGRFLVAVNTAWAQCIVEQTPDANCRANCVMADPDEEAIDQRSDFRSRCVDGGCRLSWAGNTAAVHREAQR